MAGPPSLVPAYLSTFCTLTGLATVLVVLRLWTRARIVCKVGADDWVVLLALALVFGSLGCLATACFYGLGKHAVDLTHEQETNAMKFLWTAFNITPAAEITAKVSITLMLMKVTTSRAWRWVFMSLIVINIGITVASNLTFLLSCRPLQKLWDDTVDGECDLAGRNIELYIQGISAAAFDTILAFAPIFLLWKVQISIRNKLLLCGLFALGCLTATAGIIRIKFTDDTTWSDDPTWDAMPFVLWKCVELPLSIIVGCLPTLRPLFVLQKQVARYSFKLYDGNYAMDGGPFAGGDFAIKKTTDIYVQSSNAESASALRGEWEMAPVIEISHGPPPR